MITMLPNLPPMDDKGRPPRPLAILVGSAGDWQLGAARQLEPKAGAVVRTDRCVRGVLGASGYHPEVILDGINLMVPLADAVVVWVDDGPVWLWLEMGVWVHGLLQSGVEGYLAAAVQRKFLWGMKEGEGWHHAGHLRHLLVENGWPVHRTLEDTITAAGARLQERRHHEGVEAR